MKVLLIVFFLMISAGSVVHGQDSALCRPNFKLFDKTEGRYSLMFYRVYWEGQGGCDRSSFNVLFLLPDRVHSFQSETLYGNWVPNFYANLPLEKYEILKDSNGVFSWGDSMKISPPNMDSSFQNHFESLKRKDARSWYWICTENCIDDPIFSGIKPGRIYHFRGGLYKNYSIKEVRYYRESEYLIILTHQPLIDEKRRGMDGVIIYSLSGWDE